MDEDILPYPFLAIVGQSELKIALVLALINPQIGGVLLIGPYGVAKTTAVRGLLDLLPMIDVQEPDEQGQMHTLRQQMRIIELPLNARIEDVVGGVNERVALEQQRILLEEGVLARAHRNLLYIDEVNLLEPHLIDVILDAAAQGRTFVRRGPMTRLFPSQFILVGSMNPQEGTLRPQIMDRFGLRVWIKPLSEAVERLEVYRRVRAFRNDPQAFRAQYLDNLNALNQELAAAREILPHVQIPPDVEQYAIACIQQLNVPSHRAELALLEGARAYAAADFRVEVTRRDIAVIAPLALRQRRSTRLDEYAAMINAEDAQIAAIIEPPPPEAPMVLKQRDRKKP